MAIIPIFGNIEEQIDEKLCFIMMPFSQQFNDLYEDSIKPCVAKNNLNYLRADDIYDVRPIMANIWTSICKSRIIISDLTNKNPNVFYETGIAHTLGKDVILLTQKMDDVPFDLKHLRVIQYEFTPRGVKKLEAELSRTIELLLEKNLQHHEITKTLRDTGSKETVELIKEIVTKPAAAKELLYLISMKKDYTLEGFIESDTLFRFDLFDEKNKERYEEQRLYKAKISSSNLLRYNFHYRGESDEVLYLNIMGERDKRIEYKLYLLLVKNQDTKKKIIWDEIGVQYSNSVDRTMQYSVSAKKGEVIEMNITAKKPCTYSFMDSENYALYRSGNQHTQLIEEKDSPMFSKRFTSQKDDTYYLTIFRTEGESLEITAQITKE